VIPDEILGAQIFTAMAALEALGSGVIAAPVLAEALGSPLTSILAMAESLGAIASDGIADIEIEMSIVAEGSRITTSGFPPRIRITIAPPERGRIAEHPTATRLTVAATRVTLTSPSPRVRRVIIGR
jgi:hypothetical protein